MLTNRWSTLGLVALFLMVASASPALAAKRHNARPATAAPEACYSQAEFQADQVIEFHTELMVIGLKCRTAYPKENPFAAYHEFTRTHRSLVTGAEREVMEFFRRKGGRAATQQFDTFRTELANLVSRRAALIGETDYCAFMVPLAIKTPALSDADVLKVLADGDTPHLTRKPPCNAVAKPPGAVVAKAP